jgi:hypothetical protein
MTWPDFLANDSGLLSAFLLINKKNCFMKYLKLILSGVVLSLLFISCGGKKSKLGKLIPKDAAVVVVLDQKSIFSKLPYDEIKKTYWFDHLMKDSSVPAVTKAFMTDPSKTGIDMESPLISLVLNAEGNIHVMEMNIKDSKAYGEFLKTVHPQFVITKDKDINVAKMDSAVVEWNNERAVMVGLSGQHFPDNNIVTGDSMTTEAIPHPSADSLLAICKNIFTLEEDNSLYSNEKFAGLESEEGDVHVWINVNDMVKKSMGEMKGPMGMIKLDKFLKDNYSTFTFNFANGKITCNHKQYFGKELSDILKNGDGDLSTEMVKKLPQENIAGVFAMHFTPANILEIIRLTGLDGFINLFMAQKGLTLDDVVKATKGDMVFSVGDIKMKDDTVNIKGMDTVSSYPQKSDATFLFSIAIGDKDAFNKVLGLGNEMQKDMTDKNVFQKKDDKYFVISNRQDAADKFLSGAGTDKPFLSALKDHAMGGFVDIQMILKAMQPELAKDSTGKKYYDRNISMWNNVVFTGGEFKKGGIVHFAELNMVDNNTNSLKQLNSFVDDMVKLSVENKKKHSEEMEKADKKMRTDTITTGPAKKKVLKKKK